MRIRGRQAVAARMAAKCLPDNGDSHGIHTLSTGPPRPRRAESIRVTALAPTAEVAGEPRAGSAWDVAEACLAVAAFAVLCVLVLRTSPYLPEPDDYAYRASIVAVTDGHFLTLSGAQAHALAQHIGPAMFGPGPS